MRMLAFLVLVLSGALAGWAIGQDEALATRLVLTAVGALMDVRRALWAYHFAFTYWAGIGMGALILLGSLHVTKARWAVMVRVPRVSVTVLSDRVRPSSG